MNEKSEADRNDPLRHTDEFSNDLRRKSVRAGAAVIAGQIVLNALNLVAMMILARLLTPTDFGLVAMVLVILGSAVMFRDLGLTAATIQRRDIDLGTINSLFWVNLGMGALLTAVLFLLAPAVVYLYDQPELLRITQALAFVSLIDGVAVQHQAIVRRQLRLGTLTKIEVLAAVVGLGSAIMLAYHDFGYWALVAMQLIQISIRSALCWVATGWRPTPAFRFVDIRSLVTFGGYITGARFLNNLTKLVDKVLIGIFTSAEQLGIYSKAYNAVLLPADRVNMASSRVALPTLSRLQDDPYRFRAYYRKAVMLLTTVSFPVIALLFLEAKSAILIVLGNQWLFAVPLIQILAPVAAITIVTMTLRWVLVSLGLRNRLLRWQSIESAIKIVGIAIGIPWGSIGVAYSLLISSAALLIPSLWFCFQTTDVRQSDVFAAVWRPAVASLIALLLITVVEPLDASNLHVVARLATIAALYFAMYLATWLILPNGRGVLVEMLALTRDLRTAPRT